MALLSMQLFRACGGRALDEVIVPCAPRGFDEELRNCYACGGRSEMLCGEQRCLFAVQSQSGNGL